MRKRTRLLFYGDKGPGINTGFAKVINNMAPPIQRGFGDQIAPIDFFATNYLGELYQDELGGMVCSAQRSAPAEVFDEFGRIGFPKLIQTNTIPDEETGEIMAYDGIFMLHDLGVILPFVPVLREVQAENTRNNRRNFKGIIYTPIDAEIPAQTLTNIEFFDAIVTYNEFGREQIIRHRPELKKKVYAVPHGVDMRVFHHFHGDDGYEFRQAYFGKHADRFIICNVNRNQHRKDIPNTILAFLEFKRKHNENAFLYLHMHPNDPMGWDIRALCMQKGLREGRDYAFPPQSWVTIDRKEYDVYECDEATLNKIYNACDVYLTTTRGEGWGLSVVEAMACRLPVICPLNSSMGEITDYGKRAYVLENQYPIASRSDNVWRDQVDPDEAAAMLNEVWGDWQVNASRLRNKLDLAEKYARSLSWQKIADRWIEIFKEVY